MYIEVFQTGCGDAICINFTGESGKHRRILVDSGYVYSYAAELFPWLEKFEEKEQIDLWILTHLDADHINGAFSYFSSKGKGIRNGIIHRLWFNFFGEFPIIDEDDDNVSYHKAINLRDSLSATGCKNINDEIITGMEPFLLDGAKITILSPDQAAYDQLQKEWETFEQAFQEPEEAEDVAGAVYAKDADKIATLANVADRKEKMSDTTNRSSIAFLFEYGQESILMLGDAFPSVICSSIKAILKERGLDKLHISYVKLAHHGSIKNYSKELFDLIDCDKFIICSDGYNRYKLPNKETLSKILVRQDKTMPVTFFCNYNSERYTDMFDVDKDDIKDYNFTLEFPEEDETRIVIPNAKQDDESGD
jgi:beta-lactamase superfamily II metal-dependent hydrolase